MSASTTPNLSLPSKAPTERYQQESHNTEKIAVYSLVGLDQEGTDGLLKALENNDDNLQDAAGLPPKHDFSGKPLKDVYDYHLQIGSEGNYHPTLFIVAHNRDYKSDGVLLVNLDIDLKCSVDTCRIKPSEALSAAVNLEIANMDWEDFKEDELPLPSTAASSVRDAHAEQGGTQQAAQPTTPQYVFGAYGIAPGANMTELRGLLEPDWREKAPKDYLCESVGSYSDSSDPWKELIRHHPWNCRRNPRLHRKWCICVDQRNPKDEGVLLVHIDWDGVVDRDPNELLKVGLDVGVTTERCSVGNAVTTLTSLASRAMGSH